MLFTNENVNYAWNNVHCTSEQWSVVCQTYKGACATQKQVQTSRGPCEKVFSTRETMLY